MPEPIYRPGKLHDDASHRGRPSSVLDLLGVVAEYWVGVNVPTQPKAVAPLFNLCLDLDLIKGLF